MSPGVCLVGEGPGASLVGFMMANDNKGLVQCGVMLNPVTDWKTIGEKLAIIYNKYIFQQLMSVYLALFSFSNTLAPVITSGLLRQCLAVSPTILSIIFYSRHQDCSDMSFVILSQPSLILSNLDI